MKQLRKRFLAFLALTLFGGAGAWAQGIHVTFFDVPDSWNGDSTYITAADLEGFQSITADEAQAGASIQPESVVYLFYAINGQNVSMMAFASGMFGGGTTEPVTRNAFYVAQHEGVKIYYSSVIELTPSSNNTVWTLSQTPDYDLELQVEYYEPHALKNIPAGWQVMVNGVDKTAAIEGDSLMITETDSVTLIPDGNPRRVKSVTLEDEVPPALAPAFENGAKFKVGYRWNNSCTTYLEFKNSGGTYSLTSVSGNNQNNAFNTSTLTVNGNVLVLDVVCQPDNRLDEFCAQIEFDATSSTYQYSIKGGRFIGIISVSVNDTDITNQLSENTN